MKVFKFQQYIFFLILLVLCQCFYNGNISAQVLNASWGHNTGGSSDDRGQGIATDANNNVYVVGHFKGTNIDFNPSMMATDNFSSIGGSEDIFLVKYNSAGEFQWAKAIGGNTSTDVDRGLGVAVDASGFVYITGQFEGSSADFGGTLVDASGGAHDIFIAKYNGDGALQWVKNIGGSNDDVGRAIKTDAAGNVYVLGEFESTVDFDPSNSGGEETAAGKDIFLLKLDSDGDFQWVNAFGGSGSDDGGNDIAIDNSGNVHITGLYTATAAIDFGGGVSLPIASRDIFIIKIDTNGGYSWAAHIGGGSNDEGKGIALDASGNVFVTGYFEGSNIDFNPGAEVVNLSSNGDQDAFLLKLNAEGTYQWATNFSLNTSNDEGRGVAVDSNGDIHLAGFVRININLGGSTIGSGTGDTQFDFFFAKFDTDGNHLNSFHIQSENAESPQGIAIDTDGNILSVGYFSNVGSFNINPNGSSIILDSNGGNDFYVLKYLKPLPEINVTQSTTTVNSGDNVAFNPTNVGSTDNLNFSIENAGGADLNLTGAPTIQIAGTHAAEFTVNSGPATTITPTNSTTFDIDFSPTADGTRETTLTIVNNDADEDPFVINLSGEGLVPQPEIKVSLSEIEYTSGSEVFLNTVSVGNTSAHTFTIENTGAGDLNLTGSSDLIEITGTNASEFSITMNATTPITSSGSTTFQVTFSPAGIGNREAVLSIPNNDSDENPYVLDIVGSGGDPEQVLFNQKGVNIDDDNVGQRVAGVIPNGETEEAIFGLFNNGTGSLVVASVVIADDLEGNFSISNPPQSVIEPDSIGRFSIAFTPVTQGLKQAKIVVTSNDADESQR